MADPLIDARRELDEEFAQVRKHLEKVHDALKKVEAAGPEDELFHLLDELEDAVKKVRTGGMLGSGAKGHREALEKYRKLAGR